MISPNIKSKPISERFDHLLRVISSEPFLKKQGLGNEVPFFICPYDPVEMVEMERMIWNLHKQLGNRGITVLTVNLYQCAIELLEKREILGRILNEEHKMEKSELKELLQGVLDSQDHLVPYIKEMMDSARFNVMFISGVGHVFPYIRSHNVLNNLQKTAKDQPTVMFFPGEYTHSLETGASLDLFGRLHDDKYYRAFNIYNYEI